MKLGVFSRLVIVCSVFWMIGGTLYFASSTSREAMQVADEFMEGCGNSGSEVYDPEAMSFSECWELREDIYRGRTEDLEGGLFGFSAAMAALYLALALIIVIPTYLSVRWILAGREAKSDVD